VNGNPGYGLSIARQKPVALAAAQDALDMNYEDRNRLLAPESLEFESGVERLDDGIFHVAVLTRMPGASAEMIAWWFGTYMQTTEHYRMWHPRDHVWMAWENKSPGTHVGAHHLVHEYIGGKLHKLRITFLDPVENMGPDANASGRLFICARVGLLGRPIAVARMVHAAHDTPWGCTLRSHFWMGHVETRLLAGLVQAAGNTQWIRKRVLSRADAHALEAHCHEEMTTLAGFLPELFASAQPTLPGA
jgi:hypothetical protein